MRIPATGVSTSTVRAFASLVALFIVSIGTIGVSPVRAQAVWTYYSGGSVTTLNKVVYGDTQFVTVGDAGVIRTSKDGTEWTSRSETGYSHTGLVWTGTQYVLAGQIGIVKTSPDAINWTTRTTNSSSNLLDVYWSGSLFYAVGGNGALLTSPDAINWTSRTSNTTNTLRSTVSNGTVTVVVGESGTIRVSANSTSWTSRTLSPAYSMQTVTHGGGLFVAAGLSGKIFTSPDGSTWTERTSGTTADIFVVKWIDGRFIGLVYGSVLTSPDGINWTVSTGGPADLMFGLAVDSNRYVAVGNAARVYTSPRVPITALRSESRRAAFVSTPSGAAPFRFPVPAGMESGRLQVRDARGVTVWSRPFRTPETALIWDGKSGRGDRLAPGVYSYGFVPAGRVTGSAESGGTTGQIVLGL